jgi:hypothetical protein
VNHMPTIVGGFYRSGTSLVRRLLDSHSRIHCGPEVKFFKDFYGDYLHDGLHHVRLFKTLASIGLSEEELLMLFGNTFIAAHELAASKAGKRRWADKNPENVLYLSQWNRLIPAGFLFVYVVRHPLDALASLKEIGFSKAVPTGFEDKAKLYLQYHQIAEAYIRNHKQTSVRLRYEDLAKNPENTLAALFEFLGEKYEPSVLSGFFASERRAGIEDPKVGMTRYIHSDSVGRWRKIIEPSEEKIARNILGPIINWHE